MRFSWLTKQIQKNILLLIVIGIICIGLSFTSLARKYALLIIFTTFALAFYSKHIINKLDKRLMPGLEGEKLVAEELKKLPSEYKLIKDFNYENKDSADFVVIGPTGVWTVEVKNYEAGEITFQDKELLSNGRKFKKNILHQAYNETLNAQTLLSSSGRAVPVRPIIVFTNKWSKIRFGFKPVDDVHVVGLAWINKLIHEYPSEPKLTEDQCNSLHVLMKKYSSII